MTPPFITAAAVEGKLDWRRMVAALEAGHRGPPPDLSDQFLHRGGDTLLSRAAWIDGQGIAVKSVSVLPENPARGRPTVQGVMVLFNDETGAVDAVIESALVTKWKTAADSVLGAKLLARSESRRLLIVGTGAVARSLTEAYPAQFPGIEVQIWGRTAEKAMALAGECGAEPVQDLEAAVGAADIVATCTMSATPILRGAWLRPGQHIDLIGAFTARMREADDEALNRARIFVDSYDTTLEHIGELKIPLEASTISRTDVLADYYALVAGVSGRAGSDDITFCKNGGGAHLDLMTARTILEAWRA
ncbi:MAG: ornithine cyclodeaminase [Pseudomonadota bacterium]